MATVAVADLLHDPVAQDLLQSSIPAKLGYVWRDGTPRVTPIWFHWNGQTLVFGTPTSAPKSIALKDNASVSVVIDSNTWPYKVLQIRGTARVTVVEGVVPEYALAAERYFGPDGGRAWVAQVGQLVTHMARIEVFPEWANILDFETRFPSALEAAMRGAG